MVSDAGVVAYGALIATIIGAVGMLLKSYYENRQKYDVAMAEERTKQLTIEAQIASAKADEKEADLDRQQVRHEEVVAELIAQHRSAQDRQDKQHELAMDEMENRINELMRAHAQCEEKQKEILLKLGRLEGRLESTEKRVETVEQKAA